MGSPVSSVVANLFMERLETEALSSSGALRPHVWKRYVDDDFSILRRANVKDFRSSITSIALTTTSSSRPRKSQIAAFRFWMRQSHDGNRLSPNVCLSERDPH